MARVALLDVNVIVALFDGEHVHHDIAHDWFDEARHHGWATTPIVENGVLRVLSNRAYHSAALSPTTLRAHLRRFCADTAHVFWPDEVSLLDDDVLAPKATLTHRQLTDVYLLALAVQRQGTLVTFDASIPLAPVKGARRAHLTVLGG